MLSLRLPPNKFANYGHAIQSNCYASVRQLQNNYKGTVVLKGAGTLINDSELITINTSGNPGMVSGEMSDGLSGVIADLLAQDMSVAASFSIYGSLFSN